MFRPEMLEPMGFPKDVHVHGWGLSLERPTMIRYDFRVNHTRDLLTIWFQGMASVTSEHWSAIKCRLREWKRPLQ